MMAGAAFAVIYWLLLAVVGAAVQGIFVAALYRYAKTKHVSGFRVEKLCDGLAAEALAKKRSICF